MTEQSSKSRPWAWIIALLIGGGVLFLAWGRFGFGGNATLAGGHGLIDQTIGSPSPWTLAEEADPMTDERIVKAHRQIEADGFRIDTAIACQASEAILTYTFTTFDADGVATGFKQELGGTMMNPVPYHNAQFRPDAGTPQVIKYTQPRYTNIFELKVPFVGEDAPEHIRNDKSFMAYVAELAQLTSAQQLTVRLPLEQGEPVIRIDQTDKVVAGVLSQCARPAAIAKSEPRPAETSLPTGPKTHSFTITGNFRINDDHNQVMSSGERSGTGVERIASLCVGDKLVIRNDATEAVDLIGSIYASDDGSAIGTLAAGNSVTLDSAEAGEFIIDSPQHATARLRYRVSDCR